MSLHLITGYAGQEHITAADHASFNIAMFGDGEFVLDRGNKFKAEIISNNLIRILDGDLMIQGRHVRLAENTYEEVIVENGSQGMKRNDLIVARYSKDATTGIEKCEFVVLKGAENSSTAVDPEYTTGDITENGNALVTEFPLYRIKLNGLNIESVTKMFKMGETVQSVKADVTRTIGYIKSKNYIAHPYYSLTSGANGVTWTDDGEGRLTTNGTPTTNDSYVQCSNQSFSLPAGTYILNGCPKGASNSTYYCIVWSKDAAGTRYNICTDYGNEVQFTLDKTTKISVDIVIVKGYTANNLVFKPMIRDASIEDDTYEPYVPSVKSLICDIEKLSVTQSFTSSSSSLQILWTYTATKKCLITGTFRSTHNNGYPTQLSLYRNGSGEPFAHMSADKPTDKTLPFCLVLEEGQQIIARAKYNNETSNSYIVEGCVQYLE